MASSCTFSDDDRKMLATYFHEKVKKAAGGKDGPDKDNATGKAVGLMLEPLMSKADITFVEGGVITKLSDKKTKKLNIDVFTGEFMNTLTEYMCKNNKSKGKSQEELLNKFMTEIRKQLSAEKKVEKNDAVVNRLTDTSKYTGAHKERFNADGTGKGQAGRKDEVVNTGYVGNYKGEGTFGKK